MKLLSIATAKGRKNTAGCRKLAVFFLSCLFIFSSCSAAASEVPGKEIPFVKDGKLYSFSSGTPFSLKSYDSYNGSEGFSQRAVSPSLKDGYILAWNRQSQTLFHIDSNKKTAARAKLGGYISYVGKNYVLSQTNSFDENKGFGFSLYQIKYSLKGTKLKLKQVWKGNIDCFVSDCFFTDEGVCISGGNREDTKNNVFYITKKGIHKCFVTAKNSDFLRILNAGDSVYAFLSGREKSAAEPLLYSFTLDGSSEATASAGGAISLKNDKLLPQDFECFFGYGFIQGGLLVLPASVNGVISFICCDKKTGHISSVVPDVTGCIAALGSAPEGFYYMARDPLLENSYYGICLFDGKTSGRIHP